MTPNPPQEREIPAREPALPAPAERALERGDGLGRYFAELREHKPLSREEEHALAVGRRR